MYLKCREPDFVTLPYGWSRYVHYTLAVVNRIDSKYSKKRGIFLFISLISLWHLKLHFHPTLSELCEIREFYLLVEKSMK